MSEQDIPNVDDVRVYLDDSASTALMDFATIQGSVKLTITQDMLMKLIGRLKDLNFEWEKRRAIIDPGARAAGGSFAMTAIKPFSVQTVILPMVKGLHK